MNRIDKKFKQLKKEKKKAFVAYIAAGDPSLKVTEKLIFELENCGVDIIELGIPFSDPLADGPTIQAASERALKNKVDLRAIFKLVAKIRKHSQISIVFMTYFNPVYRYGIDRFVRDSAVKGVDGVIVPDLPPEEAAELVNAARKKNFKTIFLLAPTSSKKRIKLISKVSSGFIYYVSLTGVTGTRDKLPLEVISRLNTIKKFSKKPLCVGFGVSKPSQITYLKKMADGIIVGSAIVKVIQKNLGKKNLVKNVGRFTKKLVEATHE